MFLAAVPAMVLLVGAGRFVLPEFRGSQAGRLGPASVALSLIAVLLMVYGIKQLTVAHAVAGRRRDLRGPVGVGVRDATGRAAAAAAGTGRRQHRTASHQRRISRPRAGGGLALRSLRMGDFSRFLSQSSDLRRQ
ncbi:hypothetical protein ABH935_004238 [Catenulispora sp. GAS73]